MFVRRFYFPSSKVDNNLGSKYSITMTGLIAVHSWPDPSNFHRLPVSLQFKTLSHYGFLSGCITEIVWCTEFWNFGNLVSAVASAFYVATWFTRTICKDIFEPYYLHEGPTKLLSRSVHLNIKRRTYVAGYLNLFILASPARMW